MERAAVRIVLDKLLDLLDEEHLSRPINTRRNAGNNLRKLERILTAAVNCLQDAERRSISPSQADILDWLSKLRDAAFDADDVLDAVAFESLRRKASSNPIQKCHCLGPLFPASLHHRIVSNLAEVLERFNDIEEERTRFHLNPTGTTASPADGDQRQTHSSLPSTTVVGRKEDREKVVGLLLGYDFDSNLGIVSIVGMGGLGKTTLSKMVFADEEISSRFPTKIWASVYGNCGSSGIARKILEGLGMSPESSAPETVMALAREKLEQRRFLLVLDDVWDETERVWDEVRDLLSCGMRGSRVLVTTRSKKVPSVMRSKVYHLGRMSEEECWCLFKERAFRFAQEEENEKLLAIGREIARKSKGLPLVAIVLGGMMLGRTGVQRWEEVRDNEIWDFPEDGEDEKEILPALKLSYFHLSPSSKPCFAYLAVFRKGHVLDRETVIQHWVCNGLVAARGGRQLEDIGGEIFDELLSRCLLEYTARDKRWEAPIIKMHEMIHNLARFVAKDVCCILTGRPEDDRDKNTHMTRFLNIDEDPSVDVRELTTPNSPKLRTLFTRSAIFLSGRDGAEVVAVKKKMEEKFLNEILKKFRFLRVLDLQLTWIEEVPAEIGNLKHLRYLSLSGTRIKSWPDSLCNLLNLRTMKLGHVQLSKLPSGLKRLSSLHHLDIRRCGLSRMPASIGHLTSLQVLTDFHVGKDRGSSPLSELQGLNLHCSVSLRNLENVKNVADARTANMIGKENLESLHLYWTKGGSSRADASQVLNALKPHLNLTDLRISNYSGTGLPSWMVEPSRKLAYIALWSCSNVHRLEAFGQLRSLSTLQLIGLHTLKNIGEEFYGGENTSVSFPALKELAFNDMPDFETWSGVEGRVIFPSLHALTIMRCPKLTLLPRIPNLERIELCNCSYSLLGSVANMPLLSAIVLQGGKSNSIPEGSFLNLPALKTLRLDDCVELVSLPHAAIQQFSSLELITVNGCIKLVSLPDSIYKLTSLQKLEISYCIKLVTLPQRLHMLTSLRRIKLVGCFNIQWEEAGIESICTLPEFHVEICGNQTDLSAWFCYAKNLLELRIQGKHNIPERTARSTTNLVADRFLSVCCCGDLHTLPENLAIASSLEELSIDDCDSLSHLLESFKHLRMLHHLYIYRCKNLTALCNELQSLYSLKFLLIKECPKLEERFKDEQGEYWELISHITDTKIA